MKTKKIRQITNYESEYKTEGAIAILEKAWNDLPSDFTKDERIVFLELTEKIIKSSFIPEDKSN
jgi:hypothetical protein